MVTRPKVISPLEEHRRALGLSMKDLAETAGVNARTIGAIEGGALPSMRTARKLAAALKVTVAVIFPDEEEAAS